MELAGGTEALLGSARKRLDAGQIPEAIHLLDIVLEQDDREAGAVALSIEAHQKLLAESVNFWLSAWLDNQIETLRARPA